MLIMVKLFFQKSRYLVHVYCLTEEKAKVVAAVWGTEFIQFHAALQNLAPG